MKIRFTRKLFLICFFVFMAGSVFGQATIQGVVADSLTQEALFGASVTIMGTSQGAATDFDGEYKIPNVSDGKITIKVSYVGYASKTVDITIRGQKTIDLYFMLSSKSIEGQTVVVTAQASGQLGAINQQLQSNTIINVVSAAKIRQLPDDNAAAAVGRLPGVSIQNGDQIQIRGVDAKYNQVMVNGIPMPSTSMADRSSGLGFISSNMLSGIEVIKAITPDMDANTLGGVVNLRLATAQPGGLHGDAMAQGNYNIANRNADNYKFWFSVGNRFFDDNLGVMIQGNTDRSHGGTQSAALNFNAANIGEAFGQRTFEVGSASFTFGESITINSGFNLILDYKLPNGKIMAQGMWAGTVYDNTGTNWGFNLDGSSTDIGNTHDKKGKDVWISALQIEQNFGNLKLEGTLSYSFTDQYTIVDYNLPFSNASTLQAPFGLDPNGKKNTYVSEGRTMDFNRAFYIFDHLRTGEVDSMTLEGWYRASNNNFTQDLTTFALDATMPVKISSDITAILKAGAKLVRTYRFSDRNMWHSRPETAYDKVLNYFGSTPDKIRSGGRHLRLTDVMDKDYYSRRGQYFLSSEYDFQQGLFANVDRDVFDDWIYQAIPGWHPPVQIAESNTEDFSGSETFSAGYLMGTLNLTSVLTIVGGVRWEAYNMNYAANFTKVQHGVDGNAISTGLGTIPYAPWDVNNVNRTDYNLFPNVQVKYKVTDWLDFRVAYTTGVTRPDYQNIIPKTVSSDAGDLTFGSPYVKPSTAENLDVILSFYNNEIGLLTVGGFYKEIKDEQLFWRDFYANRNNYEDLFLPDSAFFAINGIATKPTNILNWTTNNPKKGYRRGFEIDWQTHLWYLPEPFNTIVISANYTKTGSNKIYWAQNPTAEAIIQIINGRPKIVGYNYNNIVTSYSSKQAGLAEDMFNVAFGVDYKDFSGRLSLNLRSNIAGNAPQWEDEFSYSGDVYRWDITLKQNLPIEGLSVALNGTNIFNNPQYNYRRFKRNPDASVSEVLSNISYNSSYIQMNLRYNF